MQVVVRPIRDARRRLRGLGDDGLFSTVLGDVELGASALNPATVLNTVQSWWGSLLYNAATGQLSPSQVQVAAADEAYNVSAASGGTISIAQAQAQATQDQNALHALQVKNPPQLPWWANPWVWVAGGAGVLILARKL